MLHVVETVFIFYFFYLYFYLFLLPQNTNNEKTKQLHKANESGEEAQKETIRLIDIGLPQSKKKKS